MSYAKRLHIELEKDRANRAYLVKLLRFLAEEIESHPTDADWAGHVVDESDPDRMRQMLYDADKDVARMIFSMRLHLELECRERNGGTK
ncbi:MAG: hypothetical protein AzoDbin1_04101 [Azoarcus sp.]|nr:hypothetical protein [Azoarcus sp.]